MSGHVGTILLFWGFLSFFTAALIGKMIRFGGAQVPVETCEPGESRDSRTRLAAIAGRALERILSPHPMGVNDWGNSGARTTKGADMLALEARVRAHRAEDAAMAKRITAALEAASQVECHDADCDWCREVDRIVTESGMEEWEK